MTPERWREVLRLFEGARALPAYEREAFLKRECSDPEVLAQVLRMLAAEPSQAFLEPPTLEEPSVGRELGDFTLLEEIGRGGMGIVYRAQQRSLRRIVAIKLLPTTITLTQRQVDRFLREARSAARLAHPNLVTVLTVGEERGLRFFAMEYVDGKNLAEELNRLRADLGAEHDQRAHLPSSHASEYFRTVAEAMRQAADGLSFAHKNGVIHRDVKPSNLLLDPSGRLKLVDFGLARDEEQGSASASGDLVGTPHYMSPEQARAHKHVVDHRTDIYSLGVVMYELLTLKRPFEGKTSQEVITNLLHKEPAHVRKLNPRVPRDLETICATAMAKEPENRYTDAGRMRDDLHRFLAHQAILARPPAPWVRLARHLRRRATWYAPTAGAAVLAAVSVLLLVRWAALREVEARLEPLRELLEREDLAMLPPSELVRALEQARDLHRRGAGGSVPGQVIARIEEVGARKKETGRARLLRGLAPPRGTPLESYRPPSDRDYFLGLALLRDALLLLPEDPELETWADPRNTYPELEFAPDPALAGAEVHLQAIDWLTAELDEPVPLGRLPLEGRLRVEPGLYRITVVRPTGEGLDSCELTRLLDQRGRVYTLRPRLRPTSAVVSGMVRVPGGRYVLGDRDPARHPTFFAEAVELPAFWIDRDEVTNAEYRAFLAETGRDPPPHWVDYTPEWDPLPVVGVDFGEAQAYAEWAGLRLPTRHEWEAAARGPEGWSYPWGEAPGELARRAVLDEPLIAFDWQSYARGARPAGSRADDVSPFGLLDVLGNVSEWTETAGSSIDEEGEPRQDFGCRLAKGAHWGYAVQDRPQLMSVRQCPVFARTEWLGFRCAKSVRER
ncbi:MAG TPA: bifunctional serine/threonine-protein kinase/formylglycine-generating enzyme family protein [Planctomycetota bacterium]